MRVINELAEAITATYNAKATFYFCIVDFEAVANYMQRCVNFFTFDK